MSRAACCLLLLMLVGLVAVTPQFTFHEASITQSVQMRLVARRRGVDWLLRQQSADGGWHSQVYGQLRGGVGNSALIVGALADLPYEPKVTVALRRAFTFLTENLDEEGLVRAPDGADDYSVYATAILLKAMGNARLKAVFPVNQALKQRLCRSLLKAQRSSANGWHKDHLDFGGWGIYNEGSSKGDSVSASNISVTAYVLEALAATGTLTALARDEALVFLSRCQKIEYGLPDDGGFVFTTRHDDPLNKAGQTQVGVRHLARAYLTPTYDGMISLLACGVSNGDLRLIRAQAWLQEHELQRMDQQHLVLEFHGLEFYAAARAARLGRWTSLPPLLVARQRDRLQMLLARQQADGAWINSDNRMREDDPLIATAQMIGALTQD